MGKGEHRVIQQNTIALPFGAGANADFHFGSVLEVLQKGKGSW
jgi:hypothetical protein